MVNVAIGYQTLAALTGTGNDNIAIGRNAMLSMPNGAYNISIGNSSGPDSTGSIF